jgi:threonine dehydratase
VFPIAQKYVSDGILVSDESIADAREKLWRTLRIAAEPGGAGACAALFSQLYVQKAGERVGAITGGGNTIAVNFFRSPAPPPEISLPGRKNSD